MNQTVEGGVAQVARESKLGRLFVNQLKDIYWAEKKLVKTLPKLEDASTSDRLKQAFSMHLNQTRNHVTRVENIFKILGEELEALKCHAIVGIISEGEDIIDETDKGSAQRDAGLISAGQKTEHYEIATYGGLVYVAETLGLPEVAGILRQTLIEEKQADALLSEIAVSDINRQASRETFDHA